MPTLIKDVDEVLAYSGRKNASVGGGHRPSSEGIIQKTWEEIYYVKGDPPRTVQEPTSPTGTYLVLDTEEDILATEGIPLIGLKKRNAWCIDRSAQCVDDTACVWEVRCAYSSNVSRRIQTCLEIETPDEGPWNPGSYIQKRIDELLALETWTADTLNEVLIEDQQLLDTEVPWYDPDWHGAYQYTPKQVQNVVGEFLNSSVPITVAVLNADYYRIYEPIPEGFQYQIQYLNKLNDKQFYGAPKGCAKCTQLDMEFVGELPMYTDLMPDNPDNPVLPEPPGGPEYNPYYPWFWHIRAQFKFRFWYVYDCDLGMFVIDPTRQGWSLDLLNQGNFMRQPKDPDDTTPSVVTDTELVAGSLKKAPTRSNLNIEGFPLKDLDPPVWLPYNGYGLANFNDLMPPEPSIYNPPDVPGPNDVPVRAGEPAPLESPVTPSPCQ